MASSAPRSEDAVYDVKQLLLSTAARDATFRERIVADGEVRIDELTLPDNVRKLLPKTLRLHVREDSESLMHVLVPTRLDDGGPVAARRVIAKAVEDPVFRRKLKAKPRPTLESELGIELPTGLDIEVLNETKTRKYLVLPADVTRIEVRGERSGAEVYAASAWCGSTLSTVIINLCPIANTNDPLQCPIYFTTDFDDCPAGTCSLLWTYGG